MIVPVGVIAKENTLITFNADVKNLPKSIKVFIEDKETGKLYRIDENQSSYQITTTQALNGKGRFYLHTKNQTLSNSTNKLNTILVYANSKNLNIKGLQEAATIKMYSMIGSQVMNKKLPNNLTHNLDISKLSKGVYLIEIKTSKEVIKRKIILE